MAASDPPDAEGDRCGDAWEAVSSVALEHCQTRASILDLAARAVGLDGDEIADMTEAPEVDDAICESPRETRKWVAVRMTDLIEDGEERIIRAQNEAWAEVIEACEELGHSV